MFKKQWILTPKIFFTHNNSDRYHKKIQTISLNKTKATHMLLMPFLLALTLFAQSASCPNDWDKEDGEISPATETRSAYPIRDVHDLSTYPVIPFNFEYHKPKPARSSFASAREFKQASYDWRSSRRVDAIKEIYRKREKSRSTLKDLSIIRITRKELIDLYTETVPSYLRDLPLYQDLIFSKKINLIVSHFTFHLHISRFTAEHAETYNGPRVDWTPYNHMLNLKESFIRPNFISMLDKINPPHWHLIKTWKRREVSGCLYFSSGEEALKFQQKLDICIRSFCERLREVAEKFA